MNRFKMLQSGPLTKMFLCLAVASEAESSLAEDIKGFSAQGVLTQTLVRNGDRMPAGAWHFEVIGTREQKWRINTRTSTVVNGIQVASNEDLAFDGKDFYYLLHSSHVASPQADGLNIMSLSDLQGAGKVAAGPYPLDFGAVMGVLWFSYFGAEYVPRETNSVMFPNVMVSQARDEPVAFSCDLLYDLVPGGGSPVFSRARYLVNSEKVRGKSVDYPLLDEPQTLKRQLRYEQFVDEMRSYDSESRIRGSYRLDEHTKTNGLIIPTRFECRFAAPSDRESPDTHAILSAQVTNIQGYVAVPLLPTLSGVVNIQDRRLGFKTAEKWRRDVSYTISSGEWIRDTNDPVIQSAAAKAPGDPVSSERTVYLKAAYVAVLVLFVLIAAIPLWRPWVDRRRRKGLQRASK